MYDALREYTQEDADEVAMLRSRIMELEHCFRDAEKESDSRERAAFERGYRAREEWGISGGGAVDMAWKADQKARNEK